MKTHSRLFVLLMALLLIAAACGSSDDSTSSDDTGTSDESTSTGDDTTTAEDDTAPAEDGGEGDAASGEPIVVGWHNLEGGVISLPEVREGFEVALAYINDELGGVNGRPIDAIICNTDASPEASIDCANQFIEQDVVTAIQGVDVGGDAMLPILAEAGIAEVGFVPFGPQQQLDVGHSFFFGSASPSFATSSVLAVQDLGAQTIEFVFQDLPSARAYEENAIRPLADELGLDIKVTYYDPAAPDFAALAATTMASNPDVIGSPALPEPDCIGLVGALKSAGYDGDIFAGACSDFITVLGAEAAAGVFMYSDIYITDVIDDAPADAAADLQIYIDKMTEAGLEEKIEGFALAGFGVAMDVYGVMSTMDGEINADTFLAAMQTASGRRFFGQDFNCDGSAWPGETACQVGVVVYEVGPDGNRSIASGGFVDISEFIPES